MQSIKGDDPQRTGTQVHPLACGPGGKNQAKQMMNDNNIKLTLLQSNTTANSKYDPPSSNYAPLSSSKIVQHFCSGSTQSMDKILMVIGGLLIVYGIVAK